MMFLSEVTFQSNEASLTMCERCDKLSVTWKRSIEDPKSATKAIQLCLWFGLSTCKGCSRIRVKSSASQSMLGPGVQPNIGSSPAIPST